MILPDVNLLVYAHNANSLFHPKARRWWMQIVQSQSIALSAANITGFVRIVTHRSIMVQPLSVTDAFQITDTWLAVPDIS